MARAASNLFVSTPSKTAPTTNKAGHPAFERPPQEQFVQTLLTNTLGSTFYQTKDELIADTERIHGEALGDPEFMAKALAYARESGFMRTQPVYGLARLSSVPDGKFFAESFARVIKTPNDLVDFASIIKNIRGGEGGRRIKRVAGNWLRDNMNEYWAIKYGSEKKNYSMRDLYRSYHPQGPKSELVNYLLNHPADLDAIPQVRAFEALKKATTEAEKVKAITDGRLPHEVASSFAKDSRKVWEAIIPNMPLFALLRNLATLERHKVLEAAKERIEKTFSNQEVVTKSKVFPFRFLEATKHVQAAWAQDACRVGLELSFANALEIEGATSISLDVSGSMSSYIQMASVFGVSTAKRASDSAFFIFNTDIARVPVSKIDSVLTQASKITAYGGTDTSKVGRTLMEAPHKVDNLIIITDEQQNRGTPLMDVIADYRRKRNDKLKVFILNVAPYTANASLDTSHPLNYYVYGMTEASLNFIAYASRGWGKFVDQIKQGKLS